MKNKTTAGILALVIGWFGVHRFYLGQKGLGILYLLFCWTFVPAIVAMIDGIVLLTQEDEKFNKKYNPEVWADQRYRKQERARYESPASRRPTWDTYASEPPGPKMDPFRASADRKYADYDFEGAIQDYRRSLNVDPRQSDVHFKLACLYSIHEDTDTALYHLSQSLEHGYYDFDEIERHDHLAFLRATPDYQAFKSNGYRIPAGAADPTPEAPVAKAAPETLELSDEMITRIERLARLKEEGILSEAAFQREKIKILRS